MTNNTFKTFFLVIGDTVLLYAALVTALFLRYANIEESYLMSQHMPPFTIIFGVWLLIFGAFGLYDLKFMKNSKRFLYRLLRAMSTNAVLAVLVLYLIPVFEIEPRRNLIIIALLATIFIFIWRYLFNLLILKTPTSKVLFFGISKDAIELADFLLKNPQLGQKPVAFMSVHPVRSQMPETSADPQTDQTSNGTSGEEYNLPLPVLTANQDLSPIIQEFDIDTIVISRDIKENKVLVSILFQVIPLGVATVEFPTFYESHRGKIPLSLIGEVWFLENLVGIRKNLYEFFKRVVDIALAAVLGIPALVLFPFVALGIVLSTPGDVRHWRDARAREGDGIIFFRQKRVGKNGTIFNFVKFRSQRLGSEKMGQIKEIEKDPRQYPFGRFLRKMYLDELPQIWNVLRGEMSFVGPRPERPEYVRELKEKIPFYEMRLLVAPGITGWAQISMENDASVEDAPEKMQYDLYYIKNRSLILDLLVALKTFFTLLKREGR